jgi:hypothetical protein
LTPSRTHRYYIGVYGASKQPAEFSVTATVKLWRAPDDDAPGPGAAAAGAGPGTAASRPKSAGPG